MSKYRSRYHNGGFGFSSDDAFLVTPFKIRPISSEIYSQ